MNVQEFRSLLKKYQLGQTSREETARLESWYRKLGEDVAFDQSKADEEDIKWRMWEIIERTTDEETPVRRIPFYSQYWVRVAASVVLMLGILGYGWMEWSGYFTGSERSLMVYQNRDRQTKSIKLSDGSIVSLQPGAILKFPRQFKKENRAVELDGEAFFKVAHNANHPFLVITSKITTRVLGTSFNVRAPGINQNISITVRTGKVAVSLNSDEQKNLDHSSESLILLPNQQAVFTSSTGRLTKVLAEQPVLLKATQGEMNFNFVDTPLPEVFRQLEDSYGIHFVYDAKVLAHCTLTAHLKSESLKNKLALISEATHIEHKVVDGMIVIEGGKCDFSVD